MFNELLESSGVTQEEATQQQETAQPVTYADAQERFMSSVVDRILEIQTDPEIDMEDIDLRSSTALRQNWLKNKVICLIGLGGIGNWVWRVLVGMGAEKLILVDPDTIEIHNVGGQAQNLVDIGRYKVDAVRDAILQFRGVEVNTLAVKMDSLSEVLDACGGAPDILITGVDNMEFRNSLNHDLFRQVYDGALDRLPELYIDLRMSLGDWTAYTLPLKRLATRPGRRLMEELFMEGGAVFVDEESVQEPCTARAIVYTGACIAAHVGALIHWYANTGRMVLTAGNEDMPNPDNNLCEFMSPSVDWPYEFSMMKTFSSRDWEPITPTVRDRGLSAQVAKLRAERDLLEDKVEELSALREALSKDLEEANQRIAAAVASGELKPLEEAPRACVIKKPAEPITFNPAELRVGQVLAFSDFAFEIRDITPTHVIGPNMITGDQERVRITAMQDLLSVYRNASTFMESEHAASLREAFEARPRPSTMDLDRLLDEALIEYSDDDDDDDTMYSADDEDTSEDL